jgi:hypothetical protein
MPVKGKVRINPIGNANNTEPSCASFKCRFSCKVGIRDAQLEKVNPEIKKKILTATLTFNLERPSWPVTAIDIFCSSTFF